MAIPPPPAPLPDQTTFTVVTSTPTASIPFSTSAFSTYSLAGGSATITDFNSITFFVTAGATLTISGGSAPTRADLTIASAVYVAGASAQQVTINAQNFGSEKINTLTVSASGATIYLLIS